MGEAAVGCLPLRLFRAFGDTPWPGWATYPYTTPKGMWPKFAHGW